MEKKNPVLIDIPLPIVTPRLLIDAVKPGDGPEIFEAVEETRADLAQWMFWEKEVKNAEDREVSAREAYARFILREELRMIARDRETGKPLVFTGFHRPNWDIPHFEIGYWVRAKAQGKGFATEAANALTRYAFNQLGAKRLTIAYSEGNEASAAVIRKLKMTLESRQRLAEVLPNGNLADHFTYVCFDAGNLPPLTVTWPQNASP